MGKNYCIKLDEPGGMIRVIDDGKTIDFTPGGFMKWVSDNEGPEMARSYFDHPGVLGSFLRQYCRGIGRVL